MTPQDFFGTVLPNRLKQAPPLSGALTFEVTGDEGGVWTIDLEAKTAQMGDDAPGRIRIDAALFGDFVHNRLGGERLHQALRAGSVQIDGDAECLGQVSHLCRSEAYGERLAR